MPQIRWQLPEKRAYPPNSCKLYQVQKPRNELDVCLSIGVVKHCNSYTGDLEVRDKPGQKHWSLARLAPINC